MSFPLVRFPKLTGVLVALSVLAADTSLAQAQIMMPPLGPPIPRRILLRGQPNQPTTFFAPMPGMAPPITPANFPGLPGIPLVNNGTLQISRNPNPTYPNATPFAYIAALPLGARLPYNGILADPQMTPGGQIGQQLNQFALQQLQQAQQAFAMQNQQLGILNPPPPPVVQAARGGRVPFYPSAMMMDANYYYAQMNRMSYAQMNSMAYGNIYQTGLALNGLGEGTSYYTGNSVYGLNASDFYNPTNLGFGFLNTFTDLNDFGSAPAKAAKDKKTDTKTADEKADAKTADAPNAPSK